jgi:hypothetical protein
VLEGLENFEKAYAEGLVQEEKRLEEVRSSD